MRTAASLLASGSVLALVTAAISRTVSHFLPLFPRRLEVRQLGVPQSFMLLFVASEKFWESWKVSEVTNIHCPAGNS